MSLDPLRVLREELPQAFARGLGLLEARAGAGAAWARERLEDVRAADGVAHLVLEGEGGGELFFDASGGSLAVTPARPAGRPRRAALAAPVDLARLLLEDGSDVPEETRALTAVVLASARADALLQKEPMRFHLRLSDLPELGERTVRVALGVDEDPPAKPAFAVHLSHRVIEDLREGEITPAQAFTGGRMRFSGDYARALSLGMQLAQRVSARR